MSGKEFKGTSRMVRAKVLDTEEVKDLVSNDIDNEIEKAEEVAEALDTASEKEDEKLITDIDMDEFFFTGTISYTFKVHKNDVQLKVLSSKELQETQAYLWKLRNEDISAVEAQLKYTLTVLSRALIKYGKKDFANKTAEEKQAFLSELPSMLIPVLYDKYALLEKSAAKLFEDEGKTSLKN